MDPNLFAIDSDRLFEVLMGVAILSILIERALAVFFENKRLLPLVSGNGIKEMITFAVAFAVCKYWDFDALSVIFVKDKTQLWGHAMTAAVVAGGSKGSIKLFHEVFNMMSTAERERQAYTKVRLEAIKQGKEPPPEPKVRPAVAGGT